MLSKLSKEKIKQEMKKVERRRENIIVKESKVTEKKYVDFY